MSEIFQIAMRTAGGRRMANAFKSVQAAIILKLACEGAGLVQVEFTKAAGECVRAFATLLEDGSEENFIAFGAMIHNLMQYEEVITRAVIDAQNRLEEEEEALSRAENGAEGAE